MAEIQREAEGQLMVKCECGFVARGSADEVVPAIQDHAFKAHNMKATREQVLARAERV